MLLRKNKSKVYHDIAALVGRFFELAAVCKRNVQRGGLPLRIVRSSRSSPIFRASTIKSAKSRLPSPLPRSLGRSLLSSKIVGCIGARSACTLGKRRSSGASEAAISNAKHEESAASDTELATPWSAQRVLIASMFQSARAFAHYETLLFSHFRALHGFSGALSAGLQTIAPTKNEATLSVTSFLVRVSIPNPNQLSSLPEPLEGRQRR